MCGQIWNPPPPENFKIITAIVLGVRLLVIYMAFSIPTITRARRNRLSTLTISSPAVSSLQKGLSLAFILIQEEVTHIQRHYKSCYPTINNSTLLQR